MHGEFGVVESVAGIVGLLVAAALVRALSVLLRLPYTVLLVVAGAGISALFALGPEPLRHFRDFQVSPEVILFVFLPTLLFESALNLDARRLRDNLVPVLILAVPGVLVSTAVIGGIVWLATPIDLAPAMLLGAILSATDPVAVIAMFRQLGAPSRLTTLVEGESLFNDATAIVVSRILLAVVAAGVFDWGDAVAGAGSFVIVFAGGALVGWVLAIGFGWIMGNVDRDPMVQTLLTTILAYASFLVAEELFHASGVMATVTAGLTIGGWGRAKIAEDAAEYLEDFWDFAAAVANALLFLFIGLRVQPGDLVTALDELVWVAAAMLIGRALVLFALLPLASRVPGAPRVSTAYQAVMYWGGLRGAIAIALVLSLPEFPDADRFVAIVIGAVLFTLLVQGLTIGRLVRWLKLDQPSLAERVSRDEGLLTALRRAQARIPDLQEGGVFSARIAAETRGRLDRESAALHRDLDGIRKSELSPHQDRLLLLDRCLTSEKSMYRDMFDKAHLTERAYRDLSHSVTLQIEAVRHDSPLPDQTLHGREWRLPAALRRVFDSALALTPLPERLRRARVASDYEEAWGRFRGSGEILEQLDDLRDTDTVPADILADVRRVYTDWRDTARERIDVTAMQFPEFVNAMQERLAQRLMAQAEMESIREESLNGSIPAGVAESLVREKAREFHRVRGSDVTPLVIDPAELLRHVPLFRQTSEADFARVARALQSRTVPVGEDIIRQGERGTSLFLIARGVIRVEVATETGQEPVATLVAGDFFGEMAVLHGQPRTATCRAVTPCAIYELRRADFERIAEQSPGLREAVERIERRRKTVLDQLSEAGL